MLIQLLYILFCFGFAYLNKVWISKNDHIYHGLNGAVHGILWTIIWFTTKNVVLMITLPFITRLFFDCFLDYLRGLSLSYVTPDPKAISDKLEQKIFKKNGVLPKLIYLYLIFALDILLIILKVTGYPKT